MSKLDIDVFEDWVRPHIIARDDDPAIFITEMVKNINNRWLHNCKYRGLIDYSGMVIQLWLVHYDYVAIAGEQKTSSITKDHRGNEITRGTIDNVPELVEMVLEMEKEDYYVRLLNEY